MKQPTPVRLKSLLMCAGLTAALLATLAPAQAAAPTATKIPEVTLEVTDKGFKLPATVPGGIVAVTIKNTGKQPHSADVLRLRPGKTVTEAIKFANTTPDDLVNYLKLVSAVYVSDPIPPGQTSARAIVDLKKGDYILDDDADSKKHQNAAFKVNTVMNTAVPKADVVVDMQDFKFAMPQEIKAGKRLWQISNTGKQWHMWAVVKTKADATAEDIMKALGGRNGPAAPDANAKAQVVGGISPMSEGERLWIEVDLQPGSYTLVCPLPDVAMMAQGGRPMTHAEHGMIKTITVK